VQFSWAIGLTTKPGIQLICSYTDPKNPHNNSNNTFLQWHQPLSHELEKNRRGERGKVEAGSWLSSHPHN